MCAKGLLLVSQHCLFRECLLSAVRTRLDLELHHGSSLDDAVDACEAQPMSLAVFDVTPPNDFTPEATRTFCRRFPETRLVVVGRCDTEATAMAYLEAGAWDFRFTDAESLDQFCDAIESTSRGEMHHNSERTRALFTRLQELSDQVARIKSIDSMILTDREMEILRLLDEGKSNKQIAKLLHISLHTVKNHVHRILEKLEVSNRREAVHLAYSHGWLKVEAS